MKQVWILEICNATNSTNETEYKVYSSYEAATKAAKEIATEKLFDLEYHPDDVKEIIDDPDTDVNGNDLYYDENDEFYIRVAPAEMED